MHQKMPANFFMLIGYTIFSFYLELICTHKFFQKAKNVLTEAASGKRLIFFFLFYLFIYLFIIFSRSSGHQSPQGTIPMVQRPETTLEKCQ